jgi:uncharacterized tellurite resistance protein B-like protein
MLRRFLLPRQAADSEPDMTHDSAAASGPSVGRDPGRDAETSTVRRIVAELESMPPDQARYLAGFAYILGRAADADMEFSPAEITEMERIVAAEGRLTESQAVLVVGIARSQVRLVGATEDYLVTREWARTATEDQRLAVLRCCFLVGAADESVSAEENAVIKEIANELDVDAGRLNEIRSEFHDRLSAVQAIRRVAQESTES